MKVELASSPLLHYLRHSQKSAVPNLCYPERELLGWTTCVPLVGICMIGSLMIIRDKKPIVELIRQRNTICRLLVIWANSVIGADNKPIALN